MKAQRRRRGRRCRPLPRAKAGADHPYKEFKIMTYYEDAQEHRLISVTRGDHAAEDRLMPRDAGRFRLDRADDKVAVVDGTDWIKNQIHKQSLPWTPSGGNSMTWRTTCVRPGGRCTGKRIPRPGGPGQRLSGRGPARGQARTLRGATGRAAQLEGTAAVAEAATVTRALLGYVTDRRAMNLHPEFRALGRQICSNPTESMARR
jgi:hypothetical protein